MSQADGELAERPDPIDDALMEAIAAEATAGGSPVADAADEGREDDAPAEPIAARCDRLGLGVVDRVRLFQAACRMVHEGHRRGRIFGDLDASRLGATEAGEAVLIPAEGEDPQALHAATSPEQVLGDPPSTASDVYALGVVLYELLTGRPPIAVDPTDPSAAARAISEQAPERPRRAAPRERRAAIGGDLDAIVLEALRKEPERRYASAAALADDLDAHLAGLPVRAGRTSEWGRVVRFARRRKRVVAALAAAVLAAAAWGVWMARESRALRRDRDRAAASSERAREALATALDRLADDSAAEGDAASLRRALLGDAWRYYYEEAVAADAAPGPDATADAVARVAATELALGRKAEAATSFREAERLWKGLAARDPGDSRIGERLAEARAGLGRAIDPGAKVPEPEVAAALAALEAAGEGYRKAADALPAEPRIRRRLARVLLDQAEIRRRRGEVESAVAPIRSAIRLLEELNLAEPDRLETRLALASAYGLMARTMSDLDDGLPAAAIALDRAIQTLDAAPEGARDDPRVAFETAARLVDQADLQYAAGAIPPASEALARASAILEGLAARFPAASSYRAELASAANLDAEMLRGRGLRAEALARVDRARGLLERLLVERPDEPRHAAALAFARQLRGRMLAQEGRAAEALKSFQSAADLLEGRKDRDPADSYALACNLALGLTLIGVKDGGKPIEDPDDPALTPGDRLRRDVYAQRAVAALRQAVDDGYDRLDLYRRDPALDALRPRDDFKKLLADLAARQAPPPAG